nr:uncharacterized protein LOC129453073 [Misgurnus anguillicaudatus]
MGEKASTWVYFIQQMRILRSYTEASNESAGSQGVSLEQPKNTQVSIRLLRRVQGVQRSVSRRRGNSTGIRKEFWVLCDFLQNYIMNFRLSSLILLLHIQGFLTLDNFNVTCDKQNICAVRGAQMSVRCSYSNINIKTGFWFSQKQRTNWRNKDEPEDLTLDSDYSGRVSQWITEDYSELTISDLIERDSGEYQLMIIMKDGVKHLSSVTVNLTVTVLQVKMNPESTGQRVKLSCDSSCPLTSEYDYYWFKNGQYLTYNQSIFVSSSGNTDSYYCTKSDSARSSSVCLSNSSCWGVTYTSTEVCALVGSTVDIHSSYSHPTGDTVEKTSWHYIQSEKIFSRRYHILQRRSSSGIYLYLRDLREDHQFAGRVEFVGNALKIKDVNTSDTGLYRFRILNDTFDEFAGLPGVYLTVTETTDRSVFVSLLVFLPQFLIIGAVWIWFFISMNKLNSSKNKTDDKQIEMLQSPPVEQEIRQGTVKARVESPREERKAGICEFLQREIMNFRLSSLILLLHIQVLQVKMNPEYAGQRVKLSCDSSCPKTSENEYSWYKNGEYLTYNQTIFVSSSENTDSYSCFEPVSESSSSVCLSNSSCWGVTYTSRRVCALVGSTVNIHSSYSHPTGYTVKKTSWRLPFTHLDLREDHQFSGRVEYLGNTLRIKNASMSDAGRYHFNIITSTSDEVSGSPGVFLSVTDTRVRSSPDPVIDGEKVILSCSTECTLDNKHTYIWYKNGQQVTDGLRLLNKLYLDSINSEELQEYSCTVRESMNKTNETTDRNNEEMDKATEAVVYSSVFVSLLVFLPQFLIIGAVWIW